MLGVLVVVAAVAVVLSVVFGAKADGAKKRAAQAEQNAAEAEQNAAQAAQRVEAVRDVEARYKGIMDVEAAVRELAQRRDTLAQQIAAEQQSHAAQRGAMSSEIARLQRELELLNEEEYFADFGLYQPRYDFEDSEKYKQALVSLRDEQKRMVKDGAAATCSTEWTVAGSAAKGRQMTNKELKLLLRAFNGECDAAIAKVKYNNFGSLEQRIVRSKEALNKLGSVNQCSISDEYLKLKLSELSLFHEYQEKKQEEKEEQQRIKEQMREEKRAQEEIDRAVRHAEEEEKRYQQALEKARAEVERSAGAKHEKALQKIQELETRLAEAQANRERAISQAQQTRKGHVYVISNIGSFGEDIFKIGLTRRLVPMDRVKELGDASVPFPFDVHAMIHSEDAPALEHELHKRFHPQRVNMVNERKEFFMISLEEVAAAVHDIHGEIEFTKLAEAVEYRKSVAMRRNAKAASPEAAPVRAAVSA